MSKFWLILICSLVIWTFAASLTFAGTFVEDFEGNEINLEAWRIYDHDAVGEVFIEDGVLVTKTTLTDWRQKGLMFLEPLNLTEGTTHFTAVFAESTIGEFPLGLWNRSDIDNMDTWALPGMRVSIFGNQNVELQIGKNGEDFGRFGEMVFPIPSWPSTIECILEPMGGSKFNITILADGEGGSCEIDDWGAFDPTVECYFYLYYTTNTAIGETLLDKVVIENPGIEGSATAVAPKCKLSTTWGRLKM